MNSTVFRLRSPRSEMDKETVSVVRRKRIVTYVFLCPVNGSSGTCSIRKRNPDGTRVEIAGFAFEKRTYFASAIFDRSQTHAREGTDKYLH